MGKRKQNSISTASFARIQRVLSIKSLAYISILVLYTGFITANYCHY
jgi:transposase